MDEKVAKARGRVDVITYIGEVSDQMVSKLIDVTLQAKAANTTEIRLIISSGGGSFSAGLAAYQHLTSLTDPCCSNISLVAHNIGDVVDEALMLFLAANSRWVSWRGLFLIHEPQNQEDHNRLRGIFFDRTKNDFALPPNPGKLHSFDRDSAQKVGITDATACPVFYPDGAVYWRVTPS